jgi:hypothetical protein
LIKTDVFIKFTEKVTKNKLQIKRLRISTNASVFVNLSKKSLLHLLFMKSLGAFVGMEVGFGKKEKFENS